MMKGSSHYVFRSRLYTSIGVRLGVKNGPRRQLGLAAIQGLPRVTWAAGLAMSARAATIRP
jgi:hypothetical protein